MSKNPKEVTARMVLAFPDLYELGMSYYGLQVLYQLLNRQSDVWAERVFAPEPDYEAVLRENNKFLCSLESHTPLHLFDVVGFSLQHELTYPDVLVMLQLGGIPILAEERTEKHPLVIAGGPCATNPEPLAAALDLVYLGDAEPRLDQVIRLIGQRRKQNTSRSAILSELQHQPGLYLPSFYQVRYHASGSIANCLPKGDAPGVIRRVTTTNLDQTPLPTQPVVPFTQVVHDRLALEIQRGCTRGCRFCQAGMINRPVRQRSQETILQAIQTGLVTTGHEQVSFLSLSAGDHPQILALLEGFFQQHAKHRISASLPSLRADSLTAKLANRLRTIRKSGFTIAPEAGSERLRKTINKNLTDQEIISAAQDAFDSGWQLLKLYFMVGLPTEQPEDRRAIVDLVARVRQQLMARGHRVRINVGISNFVPKAHTPFQWEPMVSKKQLESIARELRKEFSSLRGVKLSLTQPSLSLSEALLARGDRKLFGFIKQLAENGVRLLGWREHFTQAAIDKAWEQVEPHKEAVFYHRARQVSEIMPWDHLDLGVDKTFLLAERQRALTAVSTPDCAYDGCLDCGACQEQIAPEIVPATSPSQRWQPQSTQIQDEQRAKRPRVRVHLSKTGLARHLSHLEFMQTVFRALRRAQWPLAYTEGFHPKPRISFGPACPTGVSSQAEYLDVTLVENTDYQKIFADLEQALPDGIAFLEGRLLGAQEKGVMATLRSIRYRINLAQHMSSSRACQACEQVLAQSSWLITRKVKGKTKQVDVRPMLVSLTIEDQPNGLVALLEVNPSQGAAPRPHEVASEIFGLNNAAIERLELTFDSDSGEPLT